MVAREHLPNPFVFGTLKWFVHALLTYKRSSASDTNESTVYVDVCPEYHLELAKFLGERGWMCAEDVDTYQRFYELIGPVTPGSTIRVSAGTHHILNRIISYYHSYSGRSSVPAYYHSARNVDCLVAFTDRAGGFWHTIRTTPYFEFNLPDADAIRSQLAAKCGTPCSERTQQRVGVDGDLPE